MANSYTTIRKIDEGAYGVVEEVHDSQGNRVARKTFQAPEMIRGDPVAVEKARRRFVREVRVQEQIHHPFIMPILGHDLEAWPPYCLMPLATENFMDQVVRDRESHQISLDPLLHILAGLEELHRMGFVHRDLKPHNVLWLEDRWVLADFGLVLPALRDTTVLTGTKSAVGTLAYAAPELFGSPRSASPESDIYSFGCLLYDLVSASTRVPFSKSTGPPPLGAIIEKCTEAHPRDRFHDVASLRASLVDAVADHHITAPSDIISQMCSRLEESPQDMSEDEWLAVAREIEEDPFDVGWPVLRLIDEAQLGALSSRHYRLFGRVASAIASAARDGSFEWGYCDVLASRLSTIYDLGGVTEKAEVVLSLLKLGCNHNRWYVMRRFASLAGASLQADAADRVAVEFHVLGPGVLEDLRQIAREIGWALTELHPRLFAATKNLTSTQSYNAS